MRLLSNLHVKGKPAVLPDRAIRRQSHYFIYRPRSTLAEMYLQYLEEIYLKHYLENRDKIYYKRYIDNLLIIFDQTKTNENTIHNINNTDECLEFKTSKEENKTANYLDLSIKRNHNNVELGIYRKPTHIDITIHFSSNHPYDHKLAGFNYFINGMITMPITEQAAKQEWNKIITMAQNNGFPIHLIHSLRNKLIAIKDRTVYTQTKQNYNRKWVTFTYHSPSVHKVQSFQTNQSEGSLPSHQHSAPTTCTKT